MPSTNSLGRRAPSVATDYGTMVTLGPEPCCDCAASDVRCSTAQQITGEVCVCIAQGVPCAPGCESQTHRADCLNPAWITRCSCASGIVPQSSNPGGRLRSFLGAGNLMSLHTPPCAHASMCECFRYHESCVIGECACAAVCCNAGTPAERASLTAPRPDPPLLGCKCPPVKKSGDGKYCGCGPDSKCACRTTLSYCSISCKCRGEKCTNAPTAPIPSSTRLIFNYPEDPASAVIVKLSSNSGYSYRMIYNSDNKHPHSGILKSSNQSASNRPPCNHPVEMFCEALYAAITRYHIPIDNIIVYASRSPCYHQDCIPRCEVLESCPSQQACAKRLRCLLKQIHRRQNSLKLTMNIKILCPYVARGDLYTRQALLLLMEAGITVEPMTLKDWGDVMHEHDLVPPQASVQISLWAAANMDRYVRAIQHYINACRRIAGLSEGLWSSPFHDFLRNTILTLGITQHRLEKLSNQLDEVGKINYVTSQSEIYGSCIALDRLRGSRRQLATSSDTLYQDGRRGGHIADRNTSIDRRSRNRRSFSFGGRSTNQGGRVAKAQTLNMHPKDQDGINTEADNSNVKSNNSRKACQRSRHKTPEPAQMTRPKPPTLGKIQLLDNQASSSAAATPMMYRSMDEANYNNNYKNIHPQAQQELEQQQQQQQQPPSFYYQLQAFDDLGNAIYVQQPVEQPTTYMPGEMPVVQVDEPAPWVPAPGAVGGSSGNQFVQDRIGVPNNSCHPSDAPIKKRQIHDSPSNLSNQSGLTVNSLGQVCACSNDTALPLPPPPEEILSGHVYSNQTSGDSRSRAAGRSGEDRGITRGATATTSKLRGTPPLLKVTESGDVDDAYEADGSARLDGASTVSDQARLLERILLNFSSKSLSTYDRQEMEDEIDECLTRVQRQIQGLILYLEQKSGPEADTEEDRV